MIDNSALVELLAGRDPDQTLVRRLLTSSMAAPEILDAEALRVLRRMARRGEIPEAEATRHLEHIATAPVVRVSVRVLMRRAWAMRHAVSAYDALYVALAEELDVPLITCDKNLAGSNGHKARIEVYPVS
ncbi:MAG: type II toxin-antitoxin system VapC family toxin [Saccharothrix sp.]|nr:type II toxin-antitoxin system VapC family toxin [Saccharothrix sp.]